MLHCCMNASNVENRSNVFGYLARGAGIAHLSPITFAVDVEVLAGYLLTVRVPVGRTVKVQPHEDNHGPSPVLVGGFREFDLRAGNI